MKFKKVLVGALAVLATVSLAACSNNQKSSSSSSNEPKELNVEFVPSTQANKMEAKATWNAFTKAIAHSSSRNSFYRLQWFG
mgnify:CR=1 FL=1